jgi:uncharacterized membrane protein
VGCTGEAREHQLRLDHSADAMWAFAAAGAITTITMHLLLRRERARKTAISPVYFAFDF